MKKLVLLLLFAWLFVETSTAQVVTPQLDAAFPVELASAAGWRFGSALGVQTAFERRAGATETADYFNRDSSVLLAYQPSNIVTEVYWATPGTEYLWDGGTDTFSKTNNADARLSIALRGNKNVTIGIGYRLADQEDASSDIVNKSLYEGSFSIRLLDNLYLAAGMQRVTEKFYTGDSRKWNRILAGAALQIGDPLKRMFRLETAYQSSPKSTVDDTTIDPHRETSRMQAVTELLFDSFLFSYRYQHTAQSAADDGENDQTDIRHRYGFGLKIGSATLGFYAGTGVETAGDKEVKSEYYQATLSLGFI